jgi:hypothetical protein
MTPVKKEVTLKEWLKLVNSKFTQMDKFAEMLFQAYRQHQSGGVPHVVLYGPGGYGKTQIMELFSKYFFAKMPKVMALSSSTTVPELFGGYDLKKLITENELRKNIEQSIFSGEVGVFEEGLQAQPDVLNALKYVMTSGFMCEGDICIPLQGIYFIGTNYDPLEWAKTCENPDDSMAFLERYMFKMKVVWEDYSYDAYYKTAILRYPNHNQKILSEVASVAAELAANNIKLSPRVFLNAVIPMYNDATTPSQKQAAFTMITTLPEAGVGTVRKSLMGIEDTAQVRILLDNAKKLMGVDLSKVNVAGKISQLLTVAASLKSELENARLSHSNTELYSKYVVIKKELSDFTAKANTYTPTINVDNLLAGLC